MRHPLCAGFPAAGRGSHGSVTGRVPGKLRGHPDDSRPPGDNGEIHAADPKLRHCERSDVSAKALRAKAEAIQGAGWDSGLLRRCAPRNDVVANVTMHMIKHSAEEIISKTSTIVLATHSAPE